ncbi:MAG: hypothetical protein JW731_07295 [Bacteroidales bacterium]|nr:hypothetical protein [Bacteroidales bacterium]
MKTQFFFVPILFLAGALFCSAQSIERQVIASSGDYFEGANISLSWTLGEIATETFTGGNLILTQGFQQPGVTLRINADLTAFLEGPYNGTDMGTDLNILPDFPLSQPYNQAPWNYNGTENVSSLPNPGIVDWILVELRDAESASSATPGTRIATKAGFILADGSVVDLDGSSELHFDVTVDNNLFVVLWHRNHLGMMSAFPLTESAGVYTYNFTTAMGMAYLNGQKSLNGSVYGMYAGDADGNPEINIADLTYWQTQAGTKGYKSGDFSMDGEVNNPDKNDHWFENISVQSQVPE